MSENEIKPVAWRCIWNTSGKPAWEQYHDESDPMPEQWDCRPNEVRPLYDQSAIDQLIAELDALRSQLDWTVRENDRLLDEGRDSAAERDAAVASLNVSNTSRELIDQLIERDRKGLAKYGTTLDRADLTPEQWLQHMAEELMDGAGYALAAMRTLREGKA